MKLKLTPLYVVAFLSLTFLVHELHDWAHTLVARALSGCWGPRAFDHWEFCAESTVSSGQRALATIAGPIVNFILLWTGWRKMDIRNSLSEQSLGCTLVFASLPLNNLLAAMVGGGDLNSCLRLLFPHADASNHHLVTLSALMILVLICVPPVVRAFLRLPWWQGKLFYFPVFLLVPGFLDHWFVGGLLNRWLINASTPPDHAYWWTLTWTLVTLTGWLYTRRKCRQIISDVELPL